MDDVVAVEITTAEGEPRYLLTWGRLHDMDPTALEALVLGKVGMFGLADAISARVCSSIAEAREAPYVYEGIVEMSAQLAQVRMAEDPESWRRRTTDEMAASGKHLFYLGDPDRHPFGDGSSPL